MRLRKMQAVTIGAALLAMAGCSGIELTRLNLWAEVPDQSRIPGDATVYACASGKRLVVRYPEGGKSVVIIFPEREFRLDWSDSGYTNGRATFSTKDDAITLAEGNETLFSGCKKPES